MIVDLGGSDSWTLSSSDGEIRVPAVVPGDVVTDLERAGAIPPPLSGDHEQVVFSFVCRRAWTFSRKLIDVREKLLASAGAQPFIVCEGLDTLCSVRVDGIEIAKTSNAFQHHCLAVPRELLVRLGDHILDLVFSPVVGGECGSEWPLAAWEYAPENLRKDVARRASIRKPPVHFGWDFAPCLPTCGIWRKIGIVVHDGPVVQALRVTQHWHKEKTDDSLTLRAELFYDQSAAEGRTGLSLEFHVIDGRDGHHVLCSAKGPVTPRPAGVSGVVSAEASLTISANQSRDLRWWPRGYGPQTLHKLVAVVKDESGKQVLEVPAKVIGFRKVELIRGRTGAAFCFSVNEVPIQAVGANVVPVDLFSGNVTPARVRQLVEMCVEANMNCVRVWGGGHYESDEFYDATDQLGLLVWQEMPFSCSCYPATPEFLDSVRLEVAHQVRRLASHPSLALWCGNNEIEEGMPFRCTPREKYHSDYLDLFRDTILPVVKAEDPTIPFVRSSPSRCIIDGPFDGKAGDESDGDSHFWGLWHGKDPVDISQVLDIRPRFCSEFGFQSLPSAWSLSAALGIGVESLNLSSPALRGRQRSHNGNSKLADAVARLMPRGMRTPADVDALSLDRASYLSQVYQSLAIEAALGHLRRLWPICAGALFWQLNDVWDAPSWSCLGYSRSGAPKAKMLYHRVARAFAQVSVSAAVIGGTGVGVWLSNASLLPVTGRIVLHMIRAADGAEITTTSAEVAIPSQSVEKVIEAPLPSLTPPELPPGLVDVEPEFEDDCTLVAQDPRSCVAIATFKPSNPKFSPTTTCEVFPDIGELITQIHELQPQDRPHVCTAVSPGASTGQLHISVRAENGICPFVWLESTDPSLDAKFSHNGFTIRPYKPVTLTCHCANAEALKSTLRVKCLWD